MDDFQGRLKRLFSSREERDQRLSEILKSEDDFISIVLRGHLVIEELVFSAVAAHCTSSEHLKAANLRFPQAVAMLRALEKLPSVPGWLWSALAELNSLRNSLAHRLDAQDLSERVDRFLRTIPPPEPETLKLTGPPNTPKDAVTRAIHYMLGGMSVVAVFQSAMEELVRHSLIEHAKANPAKRGGAAAPPEKRDSPST